MRSIVTALAAAALTGGAGAASAQLLGGRVGVGAGVGVPPVGTTLDGATRTAADTVDAAKAPSVKVRAGVSARVDRGTRCYYKPDDTYFDPVYRDGDYYCEQRSGGAAVGAGAAIGRPR